MSSLAFSVRTWRSALGTGLPTAVGLIPERAGLLIEVRDEKGEWGVGEASPLEGFSAERLDEVSAVLAEVSPAHLRVSDPAGSVSELGLPPTAAHGLEQALWGLRGRLEGRLVAELLGGDGACEVEISRLVRSVDDAVEAVAQGVGTLKLKVGMARLEQEHALIRDIREAVGPEVGIRLDANGAWSLEEALVAVERLGACELELVEQPLAVGTPVAQWRELRGVGVPIAADESVRDEQSMMDLMPGLDAVVLKPMFIGGLQAAVDMGRIAIAEGRQVVVTSSLGSGVDRYGALHVAAALRGPGLLSCGLDTGGLLQDDPCSGPVVSCGVMRISGVGMGIPERLF